MKIRQKGLILVGVPLVYGIAFISSLYWAISQADRLVRSQHVVQDSMVTFITFARCSVSRIRYHAAYIATEDEQWNKRAKGNEKLEANASAHLDELRKADPSLPIPSSKASMVESVPFAQGSKLARNFAELGRVVLGEHQINIGEMSDLIAPLRNVCDARTEDATNALSTINTVLYGGIFLEFIISIALAAFFFVNIAKYVKNLLKNATSFSKRVALNPPLNGPDEIGELDKSLFHAVEQVRELEWFKQQLNEAAGQELKSRLGETTTFLVALKDGTYGKLNGGSSNQVTECSAVVEQLDSAITDGIISEPQDARIAPDAAAPRMKFDVLKQGLSVVAIPLLFQLAFVLTLGGLLDNVNKQNDLIDTSEKFLLSVNQAGDGLLEGTRFGMTYMYTRVAVYRDMFQQEITKAITDIDKAKQESDGQQDQLHDLQVCRDGLSQFPSTIEREMSRLAVAYRHDPKSSFASMSEFMDLFKDPDHPSKSLMDRIETLIKDKVHLRAYQPFLDAEDAMERLISRENSQIQKLAAQREHVLSVLNLALIAGLGLTSIVSTLLSARLMKNLISRVQHAVANSGRIVKRQTLQPPDAQVDEITFADQSLCEIANRLVALEEFKQSHVATVSRDVRTLLASVCNNLEALSEAVCTDLSPEGQRKLSCLDEEAWDHLRLVNDLLDLENMAAGKFVLDKTQVQVDELLEQTSDAVQRLLELKKTKLELDCPPGEVNLVVDRHRLIRVLVNLVSSRVKCSPEQSNLKLLAARKASEVEFRVIDHLGGIPEELRQRVFDHSAQLDLPEMRRLIGPGLTLAIARAIVEQHGGTMGVESEMGNGSTFWVKLPL